MVFWMMARPPGKALGVAGLSQGFDVAGAIPQVFNKNGPLPLYLYGFSAIYDSAYQLSARGFTVPLAAHLLTHVPWVHLPAHLAAQLFADWVAACPRHRQWPW